MDIDPIMENQLEMKVEHAVVGTLDLPLVSMQRRHWKK